LFEIDRTHIKSKTKLPTGKVKIEVVSRLAAPKRGSPLDVTLMVNGKEVAKGQVPITAAVAFTANDALDFGIDLGSPVSVDYYDQAPFRFNGTIGTSKVWYPEK
jgi:arylsulfatase